MKYLSLICVSSTWSLCNEVSTIGEMKVIHICGWLFIIHLLIVFVGNNDTTSNPERLHGGTDPPQDSRQIELLHLEEEKPTSLPQRVSEPNPA